MARRVYYSCNKCGFQTSAWFQAKRESMLFWQDKNGKAYDMDGKSSAYCVNCKKSVSFFVTDPITEGDLDSMRICPECKKSDFIGINIFKCPKCNNDLIEEEGPVF